METPNKETKRISKKFQVPVMEMDLLEQILGMKNVLRTEFGINPDGMNIGQLRKTFEQNATKEQKEKYGHFFYDFY